MSEIRLVAEPKSKIHFQIVGKKTQGIGYRAHIASLAITSGVEFLYVENLPKTKPKNLERVDVYAGSSLTTQETLDKFYQKIKKNIPKEAKEVRITSMKVYHSAITIPPVRDFVALLTAGQLSKGIKYIENSGEESKLGFSKLQKGVGQLDKDINKGFNSVVKVLKANKQS